MQQNSGSCMIQTNLLIKSIFTRCMAVRVPVFEKVSIQKVINLMSIIERFI